MASLSDFRQGEVTEDNTKADTAKRLSGQRVPKTVIEGQVGLYIATHPGIMAHTTTRKYSRFPMRVPVLCESPAIPGYRAAGVTQNVSQGGLLLEVATPLAPSTPMNLLLCTGAQNARAEAMVVWRAEDPPARMGLRFTTWEAADHIAWEHLLAFQASPTRRASVRIPMVLTVTCLIPPDTSLPGEIKNLSEDGLMIALPQAFPPPTRLTVAAGPWPSLSPVEAEMEVVWSRADPEGHGLLHGLRFCADDISKELFLIGTLLRQVID